jgi:hypothetical protein
VNPSHLWVGTFEDNQRDAAAKGRQPHYFGSKERAATLIDVPTGQRSAIARAAYEADRAEYRRYAAERRARWLARIGYTEEEWMASEARILRLDNAAKAREARWAREAEANAARTERYLRELELERGDKRAARR